MSGNQRSARRTLGPSWEDVVRVTDVRPTPACAAVADELLADPPLAALVPAVRAMLGDRLRATILFGSRARGQAWPDSDYDVLLLVNVEQSAELHAELRAARPQRVNLDLCGVREAWTSLLHDADVLLLNALTEGVVLDGEVPWVIREAVALVVGLFQLRATPAVSKGAWVAGWDLPPELPFSLRERGAFPTGGRGLRGIDETVDEQGTDDLLRALLAVRVRGDLALPRARLLALIEEHVLDAEAVRAVRREVGDRVRLADGVREILSARYDGWRDRVLSRLQAGLTEGRPSR